MVQMCKNRGTRDIATLQEKEKYSVRMYFERKEEIKVERVLSPFGFSVTLLFAP
jgi:hypothetical protein